MKPDERCYWSYDPKLGSFRPSFKVPPSGGPSGCYWNLRERPHRVEQREILKERNKNKAKAARLSQVGKRKRRHSRLLESMKGRTLATSSLDRHTERVTGSEQRVRAGEWWRPDPCVGAPTASLEV